MSDRLQKIQAMLADSPADPELLYMLAMEQVSLGDDRGAVQAFSDAISADANYVAAYHQAGRALVRLGEDARAKSILDAGIKVSLARGNTHAAGEMSELLASMEA